MICFIVFVLSGLFCGAIGYGYSSNSTIMTKGDQLRECSYDSTCSVSGVSGICVSERFVLCLSKYNLPILMIN
jgi:hypothetical protein